MKDTTYHSRKISKNRNIVETETKSILLTHKYDHSLSWVGTVTSIKKKKKWRCFTSFMDPSLPSLRKNAVVQVLSTCE